MAELECLSVTRYKSVKMLRAKRNLCRAGDARRNPRQVPKSKELLPALGSPHNEHKTETLSLSNVAQAPSTDHRRDDQ